MEQRFDDIDDQGLRDLSIRLAAACGNQRLRRRVVSGSGWQPVPAVEKVLAEIAGVECLPEALMEYMNDQDDSIARPDLGGLLSAEAQARLAVAVNAASSFGGQDEAFQAPRPEGESHHYLRPLMTPLLENMSQPPPKRRRNARLFLLLGARTDTVVARRLAAQRGLAAESTMFHFAASLGDDVTMEALLDELDWQRRASAAPVEAEAASRALVNRENAIGCCPLHLAIRKGHANVLRVMLNPGNRITFDRLRPNRIDGQTPLQMAASWDQITALHLLIRDGVCVDTGLTQGSPQPGDAEQLAARTRAQCAAENKHRLPCAALETLVERITQGPPRRAVPNRPWAQGGRFAAGLTAPDAAGAQDGAPAAQGDAEEGEEADEEADEALLVTSRAEYIRMRAALLLLRAGDSVGRHGYGNLFGFGSVIPTGAGLAEVPLCTMPPIVLAALSGRQRIVNTLLRAGARYDMPAPDEQPVIDQPGAWQARRMQLWACVRRYVPPPTPPARPTAGPLPDGWLWFHDLPTPGQKQLARWANLTDQQRAQKERGFRLYLIPGWDRRRALVKWRWTGNVERRLRRRRRRQGRR